MFPLMVTVNSPMFGRSPVRVDLANPSSVKNSQASDWLGWSRVAKDSVLPLFRL